jgi:hypothetical protein
MKLEQLNPVEAQPLEAAFASRAQMFRPSIRHPFVRTGPLEAGFRRNYEPGGIGIKRFGDEFFSHMRAVGICGVNKIDSEFNGAAQNSNCFVVVLRWPPNSFSCQAHAAEAEPVDYEIAADSELAGFGCR